MTTSFEAVRSPRNATLRLLMGLATIAVVWLLILPRAAELPSVNKRLRFLDEKEIDPSAMFYTELEVMDEILRKAEWPSD